MTMIANTTKKIYGSGLRPRVFQGWCEEEGQKCVAQTLLSVPASSTVVTMHRQECLCHKLGLGIAQKP
jgi:hypothetical protein